MKRNRYLALAPAIGVAFVLLYTVTATHGPGFVSIPAAAFHPSEHTYQYANYGTYLHAQDDSSTYFYALVQLPQGATVTKLTFYWRDWSSSDGNLTLRRSNFAGSDAKMAEATTAGALGVWDSSEDLSISYAVVDNTQYAYYLRFETPDTQVHLYGAVIEYSYSSNMPVTLHNFQEALRRR